MRNLGELCPGLAIKYNEEKKKYGVLAIDR